MTPIKGSEIANICLVKVMAYNSGGQTSVSTELWDDNSRTSRTNEYDREGYDVHRSPRGACYRQRINLVNGLAT